MARHVGLELLTESLGFDNAHFDAPPPDYSVSPRVAMLQHVSSQLIESAGNRFGATSYFSGAGGDSVFSYLRTAAPAADAFKERGIKAGVKAIQDIAELHQCTVWEATRLTFRKLARKPMEPTRANHTFLARRELPMPEKHPWLSAP